MFSTKSAVILSARARETIARQSRRTLCFLLALSLSSLCWAATPTVVQKTATASTSTGTTVNSSSLTTHTGNSVVIFCGENTTTGTLSASDGTNAYTAVGSATTTQSTEGQLRAFVAKNIAGVTHALTCTSTNSTNFHNIFVYELSGASTTAPVDVPTSSQTGGASGSSSATPSFTLPATTFANDLLLFASSCGNTCSAGSGVDSGNSQSDANGDESETYSKTATGTYTGSFSQTAGSYIVVGVAITDGVSGGTVCGQSIALIGVGCR